MTPDEMMAILRKAAAKLDIDVDTFPESAHSIEIREDGWCFVGWLNCPRLEQTYDVWWHLERQEGRLWPWELTSHGWACRPFPVQDTE